ncbi:Protein M03B6.3 [Aphelenchoides avenae]|nr:Protein M03B6.3 [Aphelenchus avenae]
MHGNVIATNSSALLLRLLDFNGNIVDMPICALKTGASAAVAYDYLVVVETGTCNEASVLVQDPGSFFAKGDNELTKFLQHKISTNEMDEMETVELGANCPVSA